MRGRQKMDSKIASESKRAKRGRPQPETRSPFEGIAPVNPAVAGIDIGSVEHYAAVPVGKEVIVRKYGCLTPDLRKMAVWIKENGVKSVVLESTGVYWIPVFEVLEDEGLHVALVDARYARNLPGRKKTDEHDCAWLQKLYSYGLLKDCFIPERQLAELRTYCRKRS